MKKIVLFFVIYSYVITNLFSQRIPYGQEFQVNTFIDGDQIVSSVATLSEGGFIVCWGSDKQDGSSFGIFTQRYDDYGIKQWNEVQVNTYTEGGQGNPIVTELNNKEYLICSENYGPDNAWGDVCAQIIDYNGTKKGEEILVNTNVESHQLYPSTVSLSNGDFFICWESIHDYYNGFDIMGQFFDSFGNKKGNEFRINTATEDDQRYPVISALENGDIIVCWISHVSWSSFGIFGQLIDPSGNKKNDEILLNTGSYIGSLSIAPLKDERFIVCWDDNNIFGQLYSSSAEKIGEKFQVNTYPRQDVRDSKVTLLSDGKFVVCWIGTEQNGYGYGVFCQIYDSYGNRNDKEFRVNSYTQGSPLYPSIAPLANGGFIVVWSSWGQDGSGYGIFGKRLPNDPLIHRLQEYRLIEPKNDVTFITTTVSFQWQQPSATIECYPWELTFDLYLDTKNNFSNPQIIKDIQDTTYTIDSLAAGKTYFWKVLAKNLAGDSLWSTQQDWGFFISRNATSVETPDENVPQQFELFQNYPNPFNSSTEIKYSLPNVRASYKVQSKIYDVLGRLVKVLVDQEQSAGSYAISWDGADLGGNRVASGVYFYRLEAGGLKSIRKMLVLQ